jgi:hypothetical protein
MGQVDVRAVWFQSVLARDLPATSIAVFPACGHRVRILCQLAVARGNAKVPEKRTQHNLRGPHHRPGRLVADMP